MGMTGCSGTPFTLFVRCYNSFSLISLLGFTHTLLLLSTMYRYQTYTGVGVSYWCIYGVCSKQKEIVYSMSGIYTGVGGIVLVYMGVL